jgi:acetylglutamate kinase
MRITVKLGGSILEETSIRAGILSQVSKIAASGHEVILVHGGGKSLSRRLSQMQIESHFKEGLRVTDAETLEVAVMVLAGEVNKRIVSEVNHSGTPAVGICGADACAVRCVRLSDQPDSPSGIGFVGKPSEVDRSFFDLIFRAGWIPVVSSIALGPDGQLYNVNADSMAAACAGGAGCTSLVYLTDVSGVKDENGSVLHNIEESDISALRSQGIIKGGMLPKTSSCLEALAAGVRDALILPGSEPDILMKFINGTLTEGTHIHGKR